MTEAHQPGPPGDIVIFFLDVSQSTVLYGELGDDIAADLMIHCLRTAGDCIESHGGRLNDTRGDEILCMFDEVGPAMEAARRLHELPREDDRLREHGITFRIGIHLGPVIESEGNLYGDAVNVAARLSSKAKANQTVLSKEVVNRLSDDVEHRVRPLGAASVRGKGGTLQLFELLEGTSTEEITEVGRQERMAARSFMLTLKYRGRVTRLTPTMIRHVIGRGKECDLRIDHPSISRQHAEIRFRAGRFYLFDVSTNGTRIITRNGSINVHRGDFPLPKRGTISFGRTENTPNLHLAFVTDELD